MQSSLTKVIRFLTITNRSESSKPKMTLPEMNNRPNREGLQRLIDSKIYVAGHRGMVGSALVRRLESAGCNQLILKSRAELDLENQQQVQSFMHAQKPDYIFLAAAKVGGIYANQTYPADFVYQNTMITANLIHAAHSAGVNNLLNLGSSCIYPARATQPMAESVLLTGTLEPSNAPYAIAKIAGIKMCEAYNRQHNTDYRSVMPTNLYGPNDNFDLQNSHVLAALLRKFHEGRINQLDAVEVWGTGKPRREFLHVDDLADACLYVACLPQQDYKSNTQTDLSHINIGTGTDVTIAELAQAIKKVTAFEGEINFNSSYPDGTERKLLDVSLLNKLGWSARIDLLAGLDSTYQWYLAQQE